MNSKGIKLLLLASVAVLLMFSAAVRAATVAIPADYAQPQAAIDAIASGSTINIATAGTYDGFTVANKTITVANTSGGIVTVGGVVLADGANSTLTLKGLTITNPGQWDGATEFSGVMAFANTNTDINLTLEDCVIKDSQGRGVVLYNLLGGSLTMKNCTLTGNWEEAVYLWTSNRPSFTVNIDGCTMSNVAGSFGNGVVYLSGNASTTPVTSTINACTIRSENNADPAATMPPLFVSDDKHTSTITNCVLEGGNIALRGDWLRSPITVKNCTLSNRTDTAGSGNAAIADQAWADGYGAPITVTNTIIDGFDTAFKAANNGGSGVHGTVWTNDYNVYNVLTAVGATGGAHSLTGDPKFVKAPTVIGNGDFHLGAGSPAIDKGTDTGLTKDRAGNSRPNDGDGVGGAQFDIGAYEAATVPVELSSFAAE